jgi:alkylated DNA repair dioxygenase AlkB
VPFGRGHALPGRLSDVAVNQLALFHDGASTGDRLPCVRYVAGWLAHHDRLLDELAESIRWDQPVVTVFGRQHATPRLTAWFGHGAYSYSGITHTPATFPAALASIRDQLATDVGVSFNSCLANLYRDGSDSMGAHSDNEPELGAEPVIASVSLGDRRRFVMTDVSSRERFTWELGAGDLLVMSGDSQSRFRHSVPKTTRRVGRRLNLTFRTFVATH